MLRDWLSYMNINTNFEFAYPWFLVLLALLPLLIVVYRRKSKKPPTFKVSTTHFIKKSRSFKTRTRHLPFVLRLLALALLIIALARPRDRFTVSHSNGEGIDIMLCMDISGSMNANDFQPTRLEASKRVAADFVQARPGDRIGVTIFSIVSYTLCPVTTDHNIVLQQLSSIRSGYLEEEGTAIGSGLATSVDGLRRSDAKSKIVILLTDGVNIGGTISPDIATNLAKTYGIKVYTIGIGTSGSMNAIQRTEDGEEVQQNIPIDFNSTLLRTIAKETGGEYFYARDNNALQMVYAHINQLEKSKVEVTTHNRYSEKYLPWLLAGLALLIIEFLLRTLVYRRFP